MPLANPLIIQDNERLQCLRSLCLLDTPADPAFDRLTQLVATILNVPVALVSLVDVDRQFFKSQVGLSDPWKTTRQMPLSHSFCQHVIVHAQPLIIDDARDHPLVYDNPAVHELNVIAYAGIPIKTSDGHVIGSFCVVDHVPRNWTPREIEILITLTEAVMTEVELRAEIIERERIEQEKTQLLTRVTELEQLKSDMIRVAAHDLRAPLNIIMGYATLLSDATLNKVEKEFLNEIDKASSHMERMIRDILSLERIEAYAAGHSESVNLNEVVQSAFHERQPQAAQKAQDYQLTLTPEAIIVQGDPVHLEEAVGNLIGNAIKYTPQEGRVLVRLLDDGRFEVEDTGCGIPENRQKDLFAPFYRVKTHETQDIEGTGLGLHLVKRIIERHGGAMLFQSQYRRGSIFGFYLPRETIQIP